MKHNLLGQRFGRLVVLTEDAPRGYVKYWICECDCGTRKSVRTSHLRLGKIKSCGCLRHENISNLKHGHTRQGNFSGEYKSWAAARGRCANPNNSRWDDYGGRGITICDRWLESFEAFYEDMGDRPTPKHTLERKDNDGPYSPDNCAWATRGEQANNKRDTLRVEHEGRQYSLAQLADHLGLNRQRLRHYYRVRNLPLEVAIERCRQPVDQRMVRYKKT